MYMFALLNKTNQKPGLFGSSLTMGPRRLQHCQAQLGTPYHPRSPQAGTVPSRILKLHLYLMTVIAFRMVMLLLFRCRIDVVVHVHHSS